MTCKKAGCSATPTATSSYCTKHLLEIQNASVAYKQSDKFIDMCLVCGDVLEKIPYFYEGEPCCTECWKKLQHDDTHNNGGRTDYYDIKPEWKDFQDVIEDREMNYAQGNILKVAATFNLGRHDGTDPIRDINKILFFANREKNRLQRKANEHKSTTH